jgi:hypothetical protein
MFSILNLSQNSGKGSIVCREYTNFITIQETLSTPRVAPTTSPRKHVSTKFSRSQVLNTQQNISQIRRPSYGNVDMNSDGIDINNVTDECALRRHSCSNEGRNCMLEAGKMSWM